MLRSGAVRVALCAAVLLFGREAFACRCLRDAAAFWPSDMRDVPRTVHPLVVGAAANRDDIELRDAGPVGAIFEAGPIGGAAWAESPGPRSSGADLGKPRRVPTTVRPVTGLGESSFELVPSETLPGHHVFLLSQRSTIVAAFATGDRTELVRDPEPVAFEQAQVEVFARDRARTTCDTGIARVFFRVRQPGAERRLLGFWAPGEEDGPPRGFVELRQGRLELSRTHVCGELGMVVTAPGPVQVTLREWTGSGFGEPVTVSFTVPAS